VAIRAYTYIDHARARAGNGWLDRNWSGFLGTTAGLLDRRGRFDWLATPGGAFALSVDGATLDALSLGDNAWSERNDPAGATLTQTKSNGAVEVRIETRAFHDHAGMMRQVSVRNVSSGPVRVNRARVEELTLAGPAVDPVRVAIPELPGFSPWRPGPLAAQALQARRGLLLTGAEPLRLTVAGGAVGFTFETPLDLLPGGNAPLPPTFCFAFEADAHGPEPFGLAQRNAYFEFLRACDVLEEPPQRDDDEGVALSWPPEPEA
jgi:hypothetical protein